jgi:hypothetical protein
MLTTVKDAVRRTRQHHAIEHATLHLLAARLPGRRMAGYSDPGGFTLLGDIPIEQARRAVSDALLHLQAGESGLAIHPNCGTNLAVTSLLTTGAALLGSQLGAGKAGILTGGRFGGALLLVVPALLAGQPLGLRLQQVTTLASVGDRWVKSIQPLTLGGLRGYRVLFD